MSYCTSMAISQPKYPYGGKSKTTAHRNEERIGSRPSFASRMVKLLFRRSSADQRAKSWPGREEPVPVPVVAPTSADHQSSANIVIPSSLGSSAPAIMLGSRRTQSMRALKHSAVRVGCSEAEWRHRQAHCANCERLFFTSLSSLSSSAGRFCSLDCKANFEYVGLLQETMDAGFDDANSYSFDSSLEGDDGN
ncbi:hypothetical protein PF008_g17652 [Phytophthora fragariae]|uniref:FLZ-type domain-containing protein n=1 Tax=Phytophthora fragariae TaxID=53985 RepID=A0A6G0R903_9STRA|nr:hypothetical protein PF008_g17652 [Phytophthora fragariae]